MGGYRRFFAFPFVTRWEVTIDFSAVIWVALVPLSAFETHEMNDAADGACGVSSGQATYRALVAHWGVLVPFSDFVFS